MQNAGAMTKNFSAERKKLLHFSRSVRKQCLLTMSSRAENNGKAACRIQIVSQKQQAVPSCARLTMAFVTLRSTESHAVSLRAVLDPKHTTQCSCTFEAGTTCRRPGTKPTFWQFRSSIQGEHDQMNRSSVLSTAANLLVYRPKSSRSPVEGEHLS